MHPPSPMNLPAADITLGIVHEHQWVLGLYPHHTHSTTECALAGDLQETEETRNIPPEESRRTKSVKEMRPGNNLTSPTRSIALWAITPSTAAHAEEILARRRRLARWTCPQCIDPARHEGNESHRARPGTHRRDSMMKGRDALGPVLDLLGTPNLQGSGPVLRDEIKKDWHAIWRDSGQPFVVREMELRGKESAGWDAGQEQQKSVSATTARIEASSERRRDGEEERRKIHPARNELRCKHGKPPPVLLIDPWRAKSGRCLCARRRHTMEISGGTQEAVAMGKQALEYGYRGARAENQLMPACARRFREGRDGVPPSSYHIDAVRIELGWGMDRAKA
ncbi:hypothetical protein B0H13DRAFT_2478776 [Mycena leptocephala]|nr:hypothetical protein B0H13DRAFT_2478776 [Mycena leptocephala]